MHRRNISACFKLFQFMTTPCNTLPQCSQFVTRQFLHSRSKPILVYTNIHIRPSRNLHHNQKLETIEERRAHVKKYLRWATYGSFVVGGCLFLYMAFSYTKTARRRINGIEDERAIDGSKLNSNFIRYKGVVLPTFVENILDKIKNFKVRDDDVWIVSFPRSGTTWTQEIVYLISSGLDFEKAKSISIDERCPYLEYLTPGIDAVDNMPSPRYIKTHMPLKFLPDNLTEKGKVIYVARNPKDLVVSYYHFSKMLKGFQGEFDQFLDSFVNSKAVGYSPWSDHVLDFWKLKENPNVLFITYEDMMEDLEGSIKKIATFLNKTITEHDIRKIAEHCSFSNMKTNEQVNFQWMRDMGIWDNSDPANGHLRSGKVGGWRKIFNEDTNYKMNVMVAHKLRGSGLQFKYDLQK